MSHDPKSILLHLDGTADCATRIALALQLAETFAARVDAMHAVTPSLLRYPVALETSAGAAAVLAELDAEAREQARTRFAALSGGSPRLHWLDDAGRGLFAFEQQALHADLLLLGQRDAADAANGELPPGFLPDLLIGTGRPALILPRAFAAKSTGRRVLVGWKQTRESARALDAALPWLRRAEQVEVLCHGDESEHALHEVLRHLGAHGIAARIRHGTREPHDAGAALLAEATRTGADLLVMGCYGHSRAREWVLGGATRSVLASMTVPVLMVH